MRPQCGLRTELTETAVGAVRKSPVSRTTQKALRSCGELFVMERPSGMKTLR